jgi:hypothetical protein
MMSRLFKNLYTQLRGDRPRPATPVAFRPTLVSLEDRSVPSTVVADFAGQGLYTYNPSLHSWHLINGNDPSAMAVDPFTGNVAATFPGVGTALWRSSTNSWQLLTPAGASILSVPWGGQEVVGEFPGYGVWAFHPNSGWTHLAPADASSLATDIVGNVVGEFPHYGVWYFTAATATWSQITPSDASQVIFAADGFVIGEFPGYGVWGDHDGGSWTQLNTADASALAGAGNGGMAAATFTGYGTYAYGVTSGAWSLLNTASNYGLATDGADFAGIFEGDYGLVTSYFGAGTGTWQDFDLSGASLLGISEM